MPVIQTDAIPRTLSTILRESFDGLHRDEPLLTIRAIFFVYIQFLCLVVNFGYSFQLSITHLELWPILLYHFLSSSSFKVFKSEVFPFV